MKRALTLLALATAGCEYDPETTPVYDLGMGIYDPVAADARRPEVATPPVSPDCTEDSCYAPAGYRSIHSVPQDNQDDCDFIKTFTKQLKIAKSGMVIEGRSSSELPEITVGTLPNDASIATMTNLDMSHPSGLNGCRSVIRLTLVNGPAQHLCLDRSDAQPAILNIDKAGSTTRYADAGSCDTELSELKTEMNNFSEKASRHLLNQ